MSSFSFPELTPAEITKELADEGIVAVGPAELAAPTPDLIFTIFSNFFAYLDPLRYESDSQIGFGALELLDNPDHHSDAIRVLNLYHKINEFFGSIKYPAFTFRDLTKPDPKHTIHHLSALVNFLYYRNEKLGLLREVIEKFPNSEDRKAEFNAKINEIRHEILNQELVAELDEPEIQQLASEIQELRQTIQNYSMQEKSLKSNYNSLIDKINTINDKIRVADLELTRHAQENSELMSKIVQSPDKLQRKLEDKKMERTKAKNAEKLATQIVQEKSTALETYSKACEKLSKHLKKMQDIQEQVAKAKSVEKEVKSLKAKLSDESVSVKSLEAKFLEKQGKVKQLEELLRSAEREREAEITESNKKLNAVRAETEWKLQCLVPREKKAENLVSKGDSLYSEADSIRAAATIKQEELLNKLKQVAKAFDYYAENNIDPFLQRAEELEAENLEISSKT